MDKPEPSAGVQHPRRNPTGEPAGEYDRDAALEFGPGAGRYAALEFGRGAGRYAALEFGPGAGRYAALEFDRPARRDTSPDTCRAADIGACDDREHGDYRH